MEAEAENAKNKSPFDWDKIRPLLKASYPPPRGVPLSDEAHDYINKQWNLLLDPNAEDPDGEPYPIPKAQYRRGKLSDAVIPAEKNKEVADNETPDIPEAPDGAIIPAAENKAVAEIKEEAPNIVNGIMQNLTADDENLIKTLSTARELMLYLPDKEREEVENSVIDKLMTFKKTDNLTGKTVQYFNSTTEARQFLQALGNRKQMKSMRWKIPAMWRRMQSEQRKTISPMMMRTMRSLSVFNY